MSQDLKRMATSTDYREEGARIRSLTETIDNERDLNVLIEAADLCDALADRAEVALNAAATEPFTTRFAQGGAFPHSLRRASLPTVRDD